MKKISSRAGVRVSSAIRATGSTAARTRVVRKTQSERRTHKPRTAYELLERVCEHILEEPRRYYQEFWAVRDKQKIADVMGSVPSCGTMACRAGWIVALNDGLNSRVMRADHDTFSPIEDRANQILGLGSGDTGRVFSACAVRGASYGGPKHGTARYAREGVKGLRKFMREYEAHLKSRLLKDVPKAEGR